MDQDLAPLGAALKATRAARKPKLTQEEAAERLGVSRATVQNIERGTGFNKVTPTMRAYAQLLGWSPVAVDNVLAGGDPDFSGGGDTVQPVVPAPSRLPLRIVDEIESDGALVDTAVIPLSPDANMVIVVKGRPDASPAEIRAALEAWRRAQPQLHDLAPHQEQPHISNEA